MKFLYDTTLRTFEMYQILVTAIVLSVFFALSGIRKKLPVAASVGKICRVHYISFATSLPGSRILSMK